MDSLTSVHEMRQGETLWKIGKDVGLNWRFIELMNKETIKNPKLIQIGQKIIVPNQLLVKVVTEIYDLISCFVSYGLAIDLILDIILYFVRGGSIQKNELGLFCSQMLVNSIFYTKIWALYQLLGRSNLWAKVYDYIQSFINYGINKLIDCLQK
ncbi:hypothetical protein ABPG72_018677 [Tetrahymena utriculariae]